MVNLPHEPRVSRTMTCDNFDGNILNSTHTAAPTELVQQETAFSKTMTWGSFGGPIPNSTHVAAPNELVQPFIFPQETSVSRTITCENFGGPSTSTHTAASVELVVPFDLSRIMVNGINFIRASEQTRGIQTLHLFAF